MVHKVGFRTGAASLLSSTTTTILLGVALGGCGGAGSHSATGTSSASHLAGTHPGSSAQAVAVASNNPTTGDRSPTKAQATAFAHAVNLTAADLPGYTASPTAESPRQDASESAELYRCAGVAHRPPPVSEVSSKTFKHNRTEGEEQISSSVAVMPTAALAARDLAAIRSKGGEACLEKALSKDEYERQPGKWSHARPLDRYSRICQGSR
jgi:hypothetical protein